MLHIPDSPDGWAHHALSHGSDMVGVAFQRRGGGGGHHMLSAVKEQRGGEVRVAEKEYDDGEDIDK